MGIQIEDGKGKGYSASVNNEGMLLSNSVSTTIEHWVNHYTGKAFMTTFETSGSSTDNCIFYLKNTDSNDDLIIEGIEILKPKNYSEIYKSLHGMNLPETISIKLTNPHNDDSWNVLRKNLKNFKLEQINNVYSKITGDTILIIKFLMDY
jgi:hypothetical protein